MDKLQTYLHDYINNPLDPYINAKLGEEYEKIGHGAAALSFFLRTAEMLHETDPEMAYCCVLKTWKQLHKQKRRPMWERDQLATAIAYLPTRPEAYYLLSIDHSKKQEWKPAYMYACLGLQHINQTPLLYDVGYPGDFMLLFQKAFTSWYVGQRKESEELWFKLSKMPNIPDEYMKIIQHNVTSFGTTSKDIEGIEFSVHSNNNVSPQKYYI